MSDCVTGLGDNLLILLHQIDYGRNSPAIVQDAILPTKRLLTFKKLVAYVILHRYTNLTLPVSNTDIMPCLTCPALDNFPSRAAISASMSLRISAMPIVLGTFFANGEILEVPDYSVQRN